MYPPTLRVLLALAEVSLSDLPPKKRLARLKSIATILERDAEAPPSIHAPRDVKEAAEALEIWRKVQTRLMG